MLAVWALVAYIAVIVIWNAGLKRNIGEAMIVGFVAVGLFAGGDVVRVLRDGIVAAATEEVVFAALAFVFMGFLLARTGIIDRLVTMLNSVLGRFRGGAGYVSTVASGLFGAVSGSGSGNAAAVGSVTIPWMTQSNFSPRLAATMVAGNAGLGISIPPSSSMFILTGAASVATYISADDLFLALFVGGAWTLLYRVVLVFYFVRRHQVGAVDRSTLVPLRASLRAGWTSLLVFLGIAVPVLLTVGIGGELVSARVGEDGLDAISIITWIPVLVIATTLLVGARQLPRSARSWWELLGAVGPKYAVIGATLFFAFAASAVLTELGLPEQLSELLGRMDAPLFVVALVVGLLVVLVAGPLTATATIAAIGPVGFTTLVAAGASPVTAGVAILVFASTEGASPPGAAPIYIASGIAGVDPGRTFLPLIRWYVVPVLLIGALIAAGVLPV